MQLDATKPSATATSVAVSISAVQKTFDAGVEALRRIDLEIPAGQFIAILGPSGCGKSTLLRMIAGLEHPTAGRIAMEPPPGRHEIAFVFQDAHLLPWRNVLKNVVVPLELAGVDKSRRLAAARAAIEQVGLADAIDRYPAQLSGGMRMRASLARAMVTRPRLLLLDEPFAALDEITRHNLDEQLRQLWTEHRMTILFVTHSTAEATFLAQRAVVLSRRPGRIVQDGMVDLPEARTAELRGTPRFAEATRRIYQALERPEA